MKRSVGVILALRDASGTLNLSGFYQYGLSLQKEVTMNIGLALRYVFRDENWLKKLVVPALYGLIPVVGVLILGGWGLKITGLVVAGNNTGNLPKVEWKADLRRGFVASLIDLIYVLPAMLFFALSAGAISFGLRAQSMPLRILVILGGLFALIGLLFVILWLLIATPAFANYLVTNRFAAAFNFRELMSMLRSDFPAWLVVILGQLLAMLIIAPVGGIFFGIGLLFTTAYAAVVYAHLLGQAYLRSKDPEVS
jgi:hypothetical protein